MTSNQYNTIFASIIKLFKMKRSEEKVVGNLESNHNQVTLHEGLHELKQKIEI